MWLIAYLLLRAVVITTIGILLLIRPHETVHRVAAFVGWVLLVLAFIDVLAAAYGPDSATRRLLWVRAAFTAIVGLVLALLTTVSVTAVAVLIAMYLVVTGGVSVVLGLHLRSEVKAWIGMAVRGGVALAAGISALVWPRLTIVVIAVILGVHWVIGGLVSVSTAVGVWLESRGASGKAAPSQPKPSASAEVSAGTSPSEGDSDESPQGGGVETSGDQREDVSLEDG
jgi:uncharacterized membrane protein HdeD (DUF308 family)